MRLTARELNDMRPDAGRFAAQLRNRTAADEIIARGHFGHHEARPESCRDPSKGSIGDAGHRRQENPVGDRNVAYFQRLMPQIVRTGHENPVPLASASLRPPGALLRTILGQSSFMPTL
jgi:hypothetical protein